MVDRQIGTWLLIMSADHNSEWDGLAAKRVTVLGLGREGTAMARHLAGIGARVTVTDLRTESELAEAVKSLAGLGICWLLGANPTDALECDVMFVSPGVPLDAPLMVEARRRKVPMSSEARLFGRLCPARIAGVTGSSGKTTTATLVARMAEAAGTRVFLGGNIGAPLIGELKRIGVGDLVVSELSSFQLDFFGPVLDVNPCGHLVAPLVPPGGCSPPYSLVLNVTPNHLDRHPTMADYVAAKEKIVAYQRPDDVAVLNWDDLTVRDFTRHCKGRVMYFSLRGRECEGAFLRGRRVMLRQQGERAEVCDAGELRLRGEHNVANVLAACALAGALGISVEAMRAVATSFTGVEHRLELVKDIGGVRYFNDSIATSPGRAIAALESFAEPVVLLAGGRDKHLPWDAWAQLVKTKVRTVVTFGEAAGLIEQELARANCAKSCAVRADSLKEAVKLASLAARPGDVVLFSPGGTSFDAFRDYEERGRQFKSLVRELA